MNPLNYVMLLLGGMASAHPAIKSRDAPVGTLISDCQVPGTIALTFDDGPSAHTPQLLDILARYDAKATFFIVGSGWRGDIDNWDTQWPYIIQRIHAEGHQLASHTWTHADLSTLSWDDMSAQITNTEHAFINVLGFMPTYMRTPYLSCNGLCMNLLANLGYKIIGTNLDTKDYENTSPDMIWNAKNNFELRLNEGGNMALAHDIHEQTVVSLTPYMLETLLARGLRPVTVGECLGDNGWGWYRGPR
ncbi:putative xylanase/chitin deacetylase [Leptodontidium sp. 2 PMI_412]|nr:putative xylanase/chitin deacetylase [Leptodontidium sp. 2 PMI_412]